MRKQFWFLLVLVVIGVIVLSVMGIKHLRAWAKEKAKTDLPKEQMLIAEIAPRPVLVDEDGNPTREPAGSITQYMLTEEYNDLSAAEKREFHDQIVEAYSDPHTRPIFLEALLANDDALTEEQRAYLREEAGPVIERVEERRGERFFALSRDEQNAILDVVINMIEFGRRQWAERAANDENYERPTATEYPTEHLRARALRSSASRAREQEFWRRLQARMEERGLEPLTGP
jgi:hypothetical protein